jgi:hypothetical protein
MINLIKKGNNMIGNIKTLPSIIPGILFLILLISCNGNRIRYTPRGYNITKPQTMNLGTRLDEISGICWVSDSIILANNDESGRIFAINIMEPGNLDYTNVKFGEKDDYEDIVKVDSAIYLLVATGKIVRVMNYQDETNIQAETVAELPGVENEFESLYYDKDINSLIMVCKDCHREKNKIRSAYRYDLSSNKLIDSPYYQIQMDQIRKITEDAEVDFRPSAASINPMDKKVYLVSSIGKLMVVVNAKTWKVEQAFGISALLFPQPEGITFSDKGDMFISNEIASEQAATIHKFRYTKP